MTENISSQIKQKAASRVSKLHKLLTMYNPHFKIKKNWFSVPQLKKLFFGPFLIYPHLLPRPSVLCRHRHLRHHPPRWTDPPPSRFLRYWYCSHRNWSDSPPLNHLLRPDLLPERYFLCCATLCWWSPHQILPRRPPTEWPLPLLLWMVGCSPNVQLSNLGLLCLLFYCVSATWGFHTRGLQNRFGALVLRRGKYDLCQEKKMGMNYDESWMGEACNKG